MLGALCTVKIYIFTEIGDIEREKLEKSRLISVCERAYCLKFEREHHLDYRQKHNKLNINYITKMLMV